MPDLMSRALASKFTAVSLLSERGLTPSTMNPRLASSRAVAVPSWTMRIATCGAGPRSGVYSAPLTGANWMYVGSLPPVPIICETTSLLRLV